MTNYEKIKTMSKQDLAMILMCPYDAAECSDNCVDCVKEWLDKEHEDETM